MSWTRIRGVFFRYWYVLKKGPQQLSDLFYWPLIDILLWGLTSVWIQSYNSDAKLSLVLLTGLVFSQVVWRGSVDVSVSILQEFWHRNLVNLFSTPLRLSEWSVGVVLFSLCKLVVTVSFGASMVFLLYGINVFEIGWPALPYIFSLLLFGWTLGFIAASVLVYWGHQIEAIAWMIGFIFTPFSAVFYPADILPAWAQTIAWALPTTYIFEAIRSILWTGSAPFHYFLASLGLNVVYLSLSLMFFKWMFEKSREKGLGRLE